MFSLQFSIQIAMFALIGGLGTVFGPLLAVVYVGQFYMVFRENRQVRALTQHFDQLVRESDIDARSVPDEILSYLG